MSYAPADRDYYDADSHIMELPNFLTSYADPKIRDQIPEVSYSASLVTDEEVEIIMSQGGKHSAEHIQNQLELGDNLTSTDLADFLVKDLNYPFRKAYSITAKIVNMAEKKNKTIHDLSLDEIRSVDKKITNKVLEAISIKNSISSKKSYGGTSFENIKKMIKRYKKEIND